MKRKQRREPEKVRTGRPLERSQVPKKAVESRVWPGDESRYLTVVGIALLLLSTIIIYGQTIRVPPIDYEDSFYLVHSPYVRVNAAFSRLDAVWNEPYFANFHPVTTSTWLIDRAYADKKKPFDGVPFRASQLLYAVIGGWAASTGEV